MIAGRYWLLPVRNFLPMPLLYFTSLHLVNQSLSFSVCVKYVLRKWLSSGHYVSQPPMIDVELSPLILMISFDALENVRGRLAILGQVGVTFMLLVSNREGLAFPYIS